MSLYVTLRELLEMRVKNYLREIETNNIVIDEIKKEGDRSVCDVSLYTNKYLVKGIVIFEAISSSFEILSVTEVSNSLEVVNEADILSAKFQRVWYPVMFHRLNLMLMNFQELKEKKMNEEIRIKNYNKLMLKELDILTLDNFEIDFINPKNDSFIVRRIYKEWDIQINKSNSFYVLTLSHVIHKHIYQTILCRNINEVSVSLNNFIEKIDTISSYDELPFLSLKDIKLLDIIKLGENLKELNIIKFPEFYNDLSFVSEKSEFTFGLLDSRHFLRMDALIKNNLAIGNSKYVFEIIYKDVQSENGEFYKEHYYIDSLEEVESCLKELNNELNKPCP